MPPFAMLGGWPSTSGELVIWSVIRGGPFQPQPYHQLQTLLAVLRAVGMSARSSLTANPGVLRAPQKQDVQRGKALCTGRHSAVLGEPHTGGLPNSASRENQKGSRAVVGQ